MTATQTPLRREPCSTRRRRTSIGDARSWRGINDGSFLPQAVVCLPRSRNRYAASIHTHLPQMQLSGCRDDADRCLPDDCKGRGERLKALAGDYCVFCSYGSVPCPPTQSNLRCCVQKVH